MSRYLSLGVLTLIGLVLMPGSALAQSASTRLITRNQAASVGLERAWFAQVDLDVTRDRVRAMVLYQPGALQDDVALDVDPETLQQQDEDAQVNIDQEVEEALGTRRVRERTFRELRETQLSEEEFQQLETRLSRSTLYVLTEQSVLQSIDAETGRTNWARIVGDSAFPSQPPAVNRDFIAVLNGPVLHVLDRDNGETRWEHRLQTTPISPCAMSANWVYVPSANGIFTALHVDDPTNQWGFSCAPSSIRITPLVTRYAVSWVTRYGRLYLGPKVNYKLERRFDSEASVASTPAYWPPYIFLASLDGYVNAINERSGVSNWRFSTGDPIFEPVMALDESAYIVSDLSGMFCLSMEGTEKWFAPGITQFVSVSPDRVYALDAARRMVVLDKTTGARLGSLSMGDQTLMRNGSTDRVYVSTSKGLIQCLRELGAEDPAIHAPPAPQGLGEEDGLQPPDGGIGG